METDELLILEKELDKYIKPLNIDNNEWKHSFTYGTRLDLNTFIVSNNEKIYPVIYVQTPYSLTGNNKRLGSLEFVIAVNNKNANMSNKERLIEVFNKILYPLRIELLRAIKYSKYMSLGDLDLDLREVKYFGYEISPKDYKTNFKAGQKYEINAHWDALKLVIPITFNNRKFNCENKIINN